MEDKSKEVHIDETPFKNQLDEAYKQLDEQLKGQQGVKNIEMEKTLKTPHNTG